MPVRGGREPCRCHPCGRPILAVTAQAAARQRGGREEVSGDAHLVATPATLGLSDTRVCSKIENLGLIYLVVVHMTCLFDPPKVLMGRWLSYDISYALAC